MLHPEGVVPRVRRVPSTIRAPSQDERHIVRAVTSALLDPASVDPTRGTLDHHEHVPDLRPEEPDDH